MEDGYTTERSAPPLGDVFFKLGVHRLQEWAHERRLPCWTSNRALPPDVSDWADRSAALPMGLDARLTLVIGDGKSQGGEQDGPDAGLGQSIDDRHELGRDRTGTINGIRNGRREAGGVRVHGGGIAASRRLREGASEKKTKSPKKGRELISRPQGGMMCTASGTGCQIWGYG